MMKGTAFKVCGVIAIIATLILAIIAANSANSANAAITQMAQSFGIEISLETSFSWEIFFSSSLFGTIGGIILIGIGCLADSLGVIHEAQSKIGRNPEYARGASIQSRTQSTAAAPSYTTQPTASGNVAPPAQRYIYTPPRASQLPKKVTQVRLCRECGEPLSATNKMSLCEKCKNKR